MKSRGKTPVLGSISRRIIVNQGMVNQRTVNSHETVWYVICVVSKFITKIRIQNFKPNINNLLLKRKA